MDLFSHSRYMRQVLDETLRCSVLGPFSARFQQIETEIGGHKLPAGVGLPYVLVLPCNNKKYIYSCDIIHLLKL